MAGIGFELRKHLRKESFVGLIKGYGFAAVLSSGPWLLSITGLMIISLMSVRLAMPPKLVVQFLVSVAYLLACSMMLTSVIQLLFTRFVSDKLFEGHIEIILPNLLGAVTLTTFVGGTFAVFVLGAFFNEPILYRILMMASFVTLCNIWVVVIFLSGVKEYSMVLGIFGFGYATTVVAALAFRSYGVEGLLGGFFIGQATLLFSMLALVVRLYPGEKLVSFRFLRKKDVHYILAAIGFFFNLGVYADKFLFWFNTDTSQPIIGPLRASAIYDLPMFLAYLSIMPGMAVFLVRMETDFVEHYDAFYNAVREGDTLDHIEEMKGNMVSVLRQGIYEIYKVQGMAVIIFLFLAPDILRVIGISPMHIHLFKIALVGAAMQVLLLSIFNVFFYLDLRRLALFFSMFFAFSNIIFTIISHYLGPAFYGYGFAVSMAFTNIFGLALLSKKLDRLEYETFMLQKFSTA